jgi:DNA-binding Lrp family transcriptional regulator
MATAFVLINTEKGEEGAVHAMLKDIPEVKEAYLVYGVYNIVARVQTGSMQELNDVIGTRIRRLEKVSSTLTTLVV